jgi:hypothetical protein
MPKYNWETIKNQYIYGINQEDGTKHYPTQEELCKIHGCGKGTIGTRAKNENWKGEKEKISVKIEKKVAEKKTEREAEDIVASDQKFESTGEELRKLIRRKIKINNDLLDKGGSVRDYDLKNLGDALRSAQEVVKTAQGEILSHLKVEQNTNMDIDLTNAEFHEKELEFMNKLIKKN